MEPGWRGRIVHLCLVLLLMCERWDEGDTSEVNICTCLSFSLFYILCSYSMCLILCLDVWRIFILLFVPILSSFLPVSLNPTDSAPEVSTFFCSRHVSISVHRPMLPVLYNTIIHLPLSYHLPVFHFSISLTCFIVSMFPCLTDCGSGQNTSKLRWHCGY